MTGSHLDHPVSSHIASNDVSDQRLSQFVAYVQMSPEIPLGSIRRKGQGSVVSLMDVNDGACRNAVLNGPVLGKGDDKCRFARPLYLSRIHIRP